MLNRDEFSRVVLRVSFLTLVISATAIIGAVSALVAFS